MNPLNILVVDDDDVDREKVRRLLNSSLFHVNVVEAANAEEAKRHLVQYEFDCAIIDYRLGDTLGSELISVIQQHKNSFCPIIMATSQGDTDIAVEMMRAGVHDYINKNKLQIDYINKILEESKRVELSRRLHESEQRYGLMMQYLVDYSIIMLDVGGRVLTWNEGAQRLTGYEGSEIIGQSTECFHLPEDVINNSPAHLLKVAAEKGRCEDEGWRLRKDGSRFFANVIVSSIKNENGQLAGFVKVTRDVTERMNTQKALAEAKEVAEKANRTKSAFLANMSHEIRTPMNGVLGMTNLLLETSLSPLQKEYAENIKRSSDGLLTIINDILDFSKIEAGKLDLEILTFDFHGLISDLEKVFQFSTKQKNLNLKFATADIPRYLKGDPSRLRQVLNNLIHNAIKFTPQGEVVVSTSVLNQSQDKIQLRFEVRDTGIGIAEETMKRMFQMFSQADSSMTRRFGGTGLGLSICKRLVELMGGNIGVRSQIDTGTTFWFELDFAISSEASLDSENVSHIKTFSHEEAQKYRILVAEDNQINQFVISEMLSSLGFQSHVVANGGEAVDALRNIPFDLVLMDIQMPEMDGHEATRVIRKSRALNKTNIPIIALTANAIRGEEDSCKEAGMNDIITKPVDKNLLAKKLCFYLGNLTELPLGQKNITSH